jgi:hypothetical protein
MEAKSTEWTWYALRHTSPPFLALWNVFTWWLYVAITHWGCVCAHITTVVEAALGICAIVGLTLNLNGFVSWREASKQHEATFLDYATNGPFNCMRFFLVPFCVASYSVRHARALGKDDWLDLFFRPGCH